MLVRSTKEPRRPDSSPRASGRIAGGFHPSGQFPEVDEGLQFDLELNDCEQSPIHQPAPNAVILGFALNISCTNAQSFRRFPVL